MTENSQGSPASSGALEAGAPGAPSAWNGALGADPLAGRTLLLGISGSIAAVKAIDVAGRLVRADARVRVVMTPAGARLVSPIAFQAITHQPVASDLWSPADPSGMDHLALTRSADLMVVAPATADTLARLALGRADDALTTSALALGAHAPLVVAPAMEPEMWAHPATQANVATLLARGVDVVGPVEGRLASGKLGLGRMEEPEGIVDALRWRLSRGGPLAGRRVVVSAGPTREAIDSIRFLSNRSTGTMGIALAAAARDAGADVILVIGPVARPSLTGVRIVGVESAAEMAEAVLGAAGSADLLIMAAAVADFTPADPKREKIKKAGRAHLTLDLVATRDILATLAETRAAHPTGTRPTIVVGFAAETQSPEAEARRKLVDKRLDFVVANRVPAGFGDGTTEVLILGADGSEQRVAGSKSAVAASIIAAVSAPRVGRA